jgi:uncharacterized NAD(P)/FAD-binding protein YdhS
LVHDVAVVGSGFSAIALTVNLLRLLPPSTSIAVIGDDPSFGRGTAYRTEFHLHRLNVPAARMSVFADQPDDFVEWLRSKGKGASADNFASRGDYGLYLRDTLAGLLRQRERRVNVDFVRAKATTCVHRNSDGLQFELDNGMELRARNVVLCLGLGNAEMPIKPKNLSASLQDHVVQNPWRLGWLSKVQPGDEICIFGSGLTMIDQVLSLRSRGHRGRIHVLSRRGLVPHSHLSHHASPVEPILPEGTRQLSALLAAFRAQVRAGTPWRALMDGLRHRTQALWKELSPEQRSRFLRHALAWWNIHRHRISPQVFSQFQHLLENGTVTVHAGFMRGIEQKQDRFEVAYRPRGTQAQAHMNVDWIVNCTGMERAGISHSPLLQEMQRQSMIAMDELGLGISVDPLSRVVGPGGQVQPGLCAVGALTAGQFWEITAVPDIRNQAKQVAELLALNLTEQATPLSGQH